jgi:hypothetical protein
LLEITHFNITGATGTGDAPDIDFAGCNRPIQSRIPGTGYKKVVGYPVHPLPVPSEISKIEINLVFRKNKVPVPV